MDGKGNVTDYESDAQGNLTSITYPNLLSRTYTHDAAGNLTSATNRRSDTITLTHDANGRPFQKIYPGGRTITYGFDARDNLTSAADTATGTILMQYNASDQLTRIDYPGGRWLGFTYDDAGRRTQRTGHDGYVLNYEYDALGRTSYLTDGPGLEIASYEYDATGRITRENKGNGTYTTYDYDAAGEVLAIVHHDPAGEVQSRFDYDYDAQGRRTSVTTLTGTTTYSYDAIGQLTGAAYSAGQSVFYDYDAAGNRTSVLDDGVESSYSTNEMNQCLQAGSVAYQYDDDGNLVQRMDAGGTTTYEYDSENRLVRVVTPTSEMFEYTYDALGNRASVSHDGSITAFLEDPDGLGNVVADYDGSGNLIARYLHGSTLLAREDPLGARQFYGYDAVGNAALLTGPSGAVANSYTYDPFGRPLVSSETVANPFKFDGQEGVRTDETGLGFMRARMYDFETGRFTSEDPIGLAGGPNLYAFVDNEPTDSTDPSGLKGVRDCHDAKSTYYLDDPCNCAACMPDVGPVLDRCTRRNSEQEHQCLIDCRIVRASQESFQACATNCMEISDRYNWLECRDVRRWLNKEQKCEDDCHVFPLEPLDWPPPPCTPYLTCPPCDGCDEGSSEALTPLDPNEKIGLPGYGSEGFTTGGEPLPYIIYFENQPTASAPAQEVFVTDILDPDADWSSFSLDEIAFGDTVVDSLAGLSSGSVTVPLPGTSLVVSIVVDYNPASGVVQWALRTIDPLTNDLPDDALAGFLPPEDGTGRGDGHVAFTVSPRASRPTGTVLTNQASIVFDTNAAIATNTWTNTLDIGGPASSIVSVVPAPGGGPMDRLVTWSGSDDAGGSGIQDYTIYISEDAGPYAAWQTDVTDTSGVITVLCDRVYRFYSRARDHVGNVEAAPAGPDQTDSFAQCNDGDACTIDACDQGAGCLHTPLQPPAETSGVTVSQSGIDTQIAWTLATNATRSEVLRGLLSALPVGPGGDDETCLGGDLGVTTVTDTEVPPENTGYWYLIRGVNSCFGNGSYGFEEVGGLPGAPRVSTTCP
jgi:RHS repeat-associated protein